MITVILAAILAIVLSYIGIHLIRWNSMQEGDMVCRCDSDLKICDTYKVIYIGDQKFLVNTKRDKPYMKYGFKDYLKDIRHYKVFTEDCVDSFD